MSAVPVLVATVEQKAVPLQVKAIGAVEAYSNVSVKTQVTGELTGVHFKEGADVSKGQLLFTLDKRPFEAALKQAQGMLCPRPGAGRQCAQPGQSFAGAEPGGRSFKRRI